MRSFVTGSFHPMGCSRQGYSAWSQEQQCTGIAALLQQAFATGGQGPPAGPATTREATPLQPPISCLLEGDRESGKKVSGTGRQHQSSVLICQTLCHWPLPRYRNSARQSVQPHRDCLSGGMAKTLVVARDARLPQSHAT